MLPLRNVMAGGARRLRRFLHLGEEESDEAGVVYDQYAFRSRERYRQNYVQLCDALAAVVDFQSLLDLGCANGFVLEAMMARGKEVRGVEISPACIAFLKPELRDRVTIGNAIGQRQLGQYDLVTCIEVAEHIPPEQSSGLLDTIEASARRCVYFTAASPYQPGHGHINCRPQFYWMNQFRKRGFDLDWNRTEEFVRQIGDLKPATWLAMNSMIFVRR